MAFSRLHSKSRLSVHMFVDYIKVKANDYREAQSGIQKVVFN